MLIANTGVLIGIVVVAVELQQTQIQMNAESSSTRTELISQANALAIELDIGGLTQKIEDGLELTETEQYTLRRYFTNIMRYFENLHYQHELGVLDNEIWQSNLYALNRWCTGESTVFSYLYPDGLDNFTFRGSFRELVIPGCVE